MADPVSRDEHRQDMKDIHGRISHCEDKWDDKQDEMKAKLDLIIDRQSSVLGKVDMFLKSYQDLKVQVEGVDGEGGLKKKLKISKERTGARLAHWPLLSLFLGYLNK